MTAVSATATALTAQAGNSALLAAPPAACTTVTVLQSMGPSMTKRWVNAETIVAYDTAKHFTARKHALQTIDDLYLLLSKLQTDRAACLIRGVADQNLPPHQVVRRLNTIFHDIPSRLCMLDVDNFDMAVGEEASEAVDRLIRTLPECFQGVRCVVQLSASMGHPLRVGALRVHLWYLLTEPVTCQQLEKWARAYLPMCDSTVHRQVQVNFTAAPVIDASMDDPFANRRVTLRDGIADTVTVPADMPLPAFERLPTIGRMQMVDPTLKHGVVGAVCRAVNATELPDLFPDHFAPGSSAERFTWLHGSGSVDGLRITDDKLHVFNSHNGSPCGVRAQNVFDFIRVHVYGHLDMAADYSLDITAAPSYRAMIAWAEEMEILPEEASETLPSLTRSLSRNAQVHSAKTARKSSLMADILEALRDKARMGQTVAWDSFTNELMLREEGQPFRVMEEVDYTRLIENLQRNHQFSSIAKENVRDAVALVGKENSFDSAVEWLNHLARWDGKERVKFSMCNYFGATDTPYTQAVSQYMWTALVARILEPGHKADMVPVAVGKQGTRKSTTIAAMVPNERFFAEIDLARNDDDTARKLQGKMIVELAELNGLRKREADSLKAFISKPRDAWVEKYQSRPTVRPRRCIFFGSTNEQQFLSDSTGNRRWLPVMTGMCDPVALTRDRDQLLAEAVCLFRANGVVHAEAEQLADLEHEKFEVSDPWDEELERILREPINVGFDDLDQAHDGQTRERRSTVQMGHLLRQLQPDSSKHTKADSLRVGALLRRKGYLSGRRVVGGVKIREWRLPQA